jgi:hypothetical protein
MGSLRNLRGAGECVVKTSCSAKRLKKQRPLSLAAKVSDGTDYSLQRYIIPGVTLDWVREELSPTQGSLADAIIDERAR